MISRNGSDILNFIPDLDKLYFPFFLAIKTSNINWVFKSQLSFVFCPSLSWFSFSFLSALMFIIFPSNCEIIFFPLYFWNRWLLFNFFISFLTDLFEVIYFLPVLVLAVIYFSICPTSFMFLLFSFLALFYTNQCFIMLFFSPTRYILYISYILLEAS